MENQTIIIINLIVSIVMPIISNLIQEIFRFLSRCKKSKCCGSEMELERTNSKNNINKV